MTSSLVTVLIGTRPQYVKASRLCPALEKVLNVEVLHSMQHYSPGLTTHDDLEYPSGVSIDGLPHSCQSGQLSHMIKYLGEYLEKSETQALVVFGDCTTTLAGAIAAFTVPKVKLIHVEAGMRASEQNLPEEQIRRVVAQLADLNLAPDYTAADNLKKENAPGVVKVAGNLVLEAMDHTVRRLKTDAPLDSLFDPNDTPGRFILVTMHRAAATTNRGIHRFINLLGSISKVHPVLWPVHPRVENSLNQNHRRLLKLYESRVTQVKPLSHHQLIQCLQQCEAVVTDSGGVQLEAAYLGKLCIVYREHTEWTELVKRGNLIVTTSPREAAKAIQSMNNGPFSRSPNRFEDWREPSGELPSRYMAYVIDRYVSGSL